jgi:hypothetical protein
MYREIYAYNVGDDTFTRQTIESPRTMYVQIAEKKN